MQKIVIGSIAKDLNLIVKIPDLLRQGSHKVSYFSFCYLE